MSHARVRIWEAEVEAQGYGTLILSKPSIEYFPAPVMYKSKKPPMMLRFL